MELKLFLPSVSLSDLRIKYSFIRYYIQIIATANVSKLESFSKISRGDNKKLNEFIDEKVKVKELGINT